MGFHQDYDDLQTTDLTCPKCGSINVMQPSFNDDMYLCSDCGKLFGYTIQKDEDQDY